MSCADFVARSFAVRTAAHLLHLRSSSYSQHIALADFYEALTDKVDAYAEVYMGLEGQIKGFIPVSPPREEPVELLENYLSLVHDEQEEDADSQALMNILADIEELTARSLYKLRFLK